MGRRLLPLRHRQKSAKPLIAVGVLSALIALVATGCVNREAIPQNRLVIALESGPRTLDPRLATDAASSKVRDLLFNGLVRRNDDFSLAPDIAESYKIETSTRYVFYLRKNVFFHNGKKLTSADVKALYEWVLNPKNKSPHRGGLVSIKNIETPDDDVVVFNLKEPSAPFLGALTMGIVPKASGEDFGERPVGTGPFAFAENLLDEKITLTRNEKYFDGPPKLEGVIFKIIPDETVRSLELESGAVHVIMNPITPDLLPRFRENKRLTVLSQQGSNYSYLGFNMKDNVAGNIQVRKALAHAIDRKSVIDHMLKGLATKAVGPFSSMNRFAEKDLPHFDYDPELAKNILDDAGLKDPDGDGPKLRFTIEYSTSQNELRKRIAEVFQWQLSKVGVGLKIRSYEWGTFYGNVKKGNFQMFSLTWVGMADPDILHYIFHSSSQPPDGANRGRYSNKKLDKLLEEGRVTTGDRRKEIYTEAQKIIAEELVYISLWHSVNVAVVNSRVKGFVVAPDENLRSIKNVTIKGES